MKYLPRLFRIAASAAPWAVGIALGLGLAVLYLGGSSGTALDENAAVYAVDLSGDVTQADIDAIKAFVDENPGKDLILKPAYPLDVAPGAVRRQRDEQRDAMEKEIMLAAIQDSLASGLFTTERTELPCEQIGKADNSEPAIYLLCGNGLRPAPAPVSTSRVKSSAEAEARLTEYLQAVLSGTSGTEKGLGLRSNFSNADALQQLSYSLDGAVTVDFNYRIVSQIEDLHPGSATHYMLEQLYRTLFQFRDVTAVTLTLDGSCEAFGEVIEGPCQDLDRELWEQMTATNNERVAYFTLRGGN